MTVSHFEALESKIPVMEARGMMRAAQAAVYPHVTKDGAQKMWQGWERAAYPPEPVGPGSRRAMFTWNGRAVTPIDLRQRLAGVLGGGLSA